MIRFFFFKDFYNYCYKPVVYPISTALLFGNDTNPAHPKHIGSIDPTCNVADVVKGKLRYR